MMPRTTRYGTMDLEIEHKVLEAPSTYSRVMSALGNLGSTIAATVYADIMEDEPVPATTHTVVSTSVLSAPILSQAEYKPNPDAMNQTLYEMDCLKANTRI